MRHDAPQTMFARLAAAIEDDPHSKLRPEQLPPPGDWATWLICAGRGFGKTFAGSHWICDLVKSGAASRIALVGATAADTRDVMTEGASGILSISPSWFRPNYEPSKRKITWPNGAIATMYSSEESDRLRGPEHDAAWCDELCAWSNQQSTWDMLQFGLRAGKKPRTLITTTPKPVKLLRELIARDGQDVVVTRGRTLDNAKNLAPSFLEQIVNRYQGTRLGRQELEAELLLDTPGALWTRDMLDAARVTQETIDRLQLRRVVVAVDPSGARNSSDDGADKIGIVVAGVDDQKRGYVLEDCTCKDSPAGWGRKAVAAYYRWKADCIVAERNFGGAMVEHVIRTTDYNVAYREVSASRGKIARAEPVAALFEQGRVSMAPNLGDLEDELCAMTSDGYVGGGSPDRADAMVWALTEVMVLHQGPSWGVKPLW